MVARAREILKSLVPLSFRVFSTNKNERRKTINRRESRICSDAQYVLVSRVKTPQWCTRFQPELTIAATLLTLKEYFLARASIVRPFSFLVLTRRV